MRKIIFTVMAGVMLCGVGWGATKCVKIPDSTVWPVSYEAESYQPYWSVTLSDGTVLRGIALCWGESNYIGAVREKMDESDKSLGCWCKIIEPFVSKYWVGLYDMNTDEPCTPSCSRYCADGMSWQWGAAADTLLQI